MHPSAEPKFEDDASGEAWFQKGVTLLHGRKRERAEDELLHRAMARSILQEWQAWLAFMIGVLALFQAHLAASSLIVGLTAFCSIITLIGAIDNVAARRARALLRWIEHERAVEREKNPKADA